MARNVRHLERLRARRLDQHRAGIRLEQLVDAGADQGIEIGGLDAIARQHAVAEIARRTIGVVADQEMVAGLGDREQGGRDRSQAGRRKADAGALRPFQRHQRILQRPRGRRAVAAILELAAMGVQIVGGRVEHGGTVDDRRIDKTLLCFGVAARRHQPGLGLLPVRCPWPSEESMRLLADMFFRFRRVTRARGGRSASMVNNRTSKRAVNPLTRLASRSVMRRRYSVAAR